MTNHPKSLLLITSIDADLLITYLFAVVNYAILANLNIFREYDQE